MWCIITSNKLSDCHKYHSTNQTTVMYQRWMNYECFDKPLNKLQRKNKTLQQFLYWIVWEFVSVVCIIRDMINIAKTWEFVSVVCIIHDMNNITTLHSRIIHHCSIHSTTGLIFLVSNFHHIYDVIQNISDLKQLLFILFLK